jgi:hypothetical protein
MPDGFHWPDLGAVPTAAARVAAQRVSNLAVRQAKTSTPVFKLPFPLRIDPPDAAGDLQALAEATEDALGALAPRGQASMGTRGTTDVFVDPGATLLPGSGSGPAGSTWRADVMVALAPLTHEAFAQFTPNSLVNCTIGRAAVGGYHHPYSPAFGAVTSQHLLPPWIVTVTDDGPFSFAVHAATTGGAAQSWRVQSWSTITLTRLT